MKNRVLIVGPDFDYHTCACAWGLEQLGYTVDLLDTSSLPQKIPPSLHIGPLKTGEGFGLHCSSAYKSIWIRRSPKKLIEGLDPRDSQFIKLESETFERWWIDSVASRSDIICVNERRAVNFAENRYLQLKYAEQLGLNVPDTIIANTRTKVTDFILERGRVVTKPLTGQVWQDPGQRKAFMTRTAVLSGKDTTQSNFGASIEICPAVYQQYIEKISDIRVVLVGEFLYAVEIIDPANNEIDIRAALHNGNAIGRQYTLDNVTSEKLKKLCKKFNLNFASMDLVVAENGELYFIDLNPAGQFLFLDDICPEVNLLEKFCAYLTGYESFTDSTVDIKRFETSDACARWEAIYDYRSSQASQQTAFFAEESERPV